MSVFFFIDYHFFVKNITKTKKWNDVYAIPLFYLFLSVFICFFFVRTSGAIRTCMIVVRTKKLRISRT